MAVSGSCRREPCRTSSDGGDGFLKERGAPAWRIMGRLRSGADARAGPGRGRRRGRAASTATYPNEHKGSKALVIPESRARPDPSVADFLPVFAVVFAAMVGLVLFIACANVANLMLSRSLVRQRDLVVRAALGAGRLRLVRLQVVESVLLALAAGVLGLVFAHWTGQLLERLHPRRATSPSTPTRPGTGASTPSPSWSRRGRASPRGLWPALQASRFDLARGAEGGRRRHAAARRHPFRNLLVMGQVTMSLVVLISAGLFLHSLAADAGPVPGLPHRQPAHDVPRPRAAAVRRRARPPLPRGPAQAGRGPSGRPRGQPPPARPLRLRHPDRATWASTGEIAGSKDGYVSTAFNVVGPGFFETAGTRLERGRAPRGDATTATARKVAVVNETMARSLWPGQDALGQRFRFGRDGEWIDVVGVARRRQVRDDGRGAAVATSTSPSPRPTGRP